MSGGFPRGGNCRILLEPVLPLRFRFPPEESLGSRLLRSLQDLASAGLALILPADCPICAGHLPWSAPAGVCRSCWAGIRPLRRPLCDRCGVPPSGLPPGPPPFLCLRCRKTPPPYRHARSLGEYEGTLRAILRLFKFEGRAEIGPILASLLAVLAREAFPAGEWDGVAPVPLHRSRRRLRGYNPAERLARPLARRLGLRLLDRALRRTRPTPPQTGLPRRERLRNVRGAFRAPRPERVGGLRILLVDDIVTTGATAAECSRELLRAGAASVDLITAARSLPGSASID